MPASESETHRGREKKSSKQLNQHSMLLLRKGCFWLGLVELLIK